MQLTGAEIFLESLKCEGVDTLFALPGGVVLKIFDVLYQQKDIRVILTRHEQGAGLMAEGYAKATGPMQARGDMEFPWADTGDDMAKNIEYYINIFVHPTLSDI